jgi:hypothetical protein
MMERLVIKTNALLLRLTNNSKTSLNIPTQEITELSDDVLEGLRPYSGGNGFTHWALKIVQG